MSDHKDHHKPNKIVKLVFEQIGDITSEADVIGLKVSLELEGRKITPEVLEGKDKTAAEVWSTEIFDLVTALLEEKAEHTEGIEIYKDHKKENLS